MRAAYALCVVVVLSIGIVFGQEAPPEAPPEPTIEPTLPLPTETPEPPTVEPPTPTPLPPTPTETPTELPTLEPTLEPTIEPTLEPTATVTDVAAETPTLDLPTETPFVIELPTELPPLETEEALTRGDRGRGAKVDQDLLALYDALAANNLPAARQLAMDEEMLISVDGAKVRIEVVALDTAEALRLRPLIEAFGGTYLIGFEHYAEYDFPLNMLDALNALPGEFTARQPLRPVTHNGTVVSEGRDAMGVPAWHARGLRGQGIRIGVIDVGFFGYPNTDTGCVRGASAFDPLPVTLTANGDHGTNVVEIICDLAPQAEVYIASANSVSALNAAVDWLIAQNVRIINMSMSWYDHPGDGTGPVNTIVNRAISRGIFWVNSAGNSQGYVWHGSYNNMSVDGAIYGFASTTTNVMNFGGSNPVLRLTGACGRTEIALRWSDWNAARTGRQVGYDLDLYLVQSLDGGLNWTHVASSLGAQDVQPSRRPNEYISVTPSCAVGAIYGILVRRWSSSAPVYIQVESYTHQLQTPSQTASIGTPADNLNVITVGASEVKGHSFWGWSPQRYPDVAPYSSRGPTLGPGGTNPSGGTAKPEVTAPTNTRTTRDPQFSGTSAAAPHATGMFAVMLSNVPSLTRSALISAVRPPTTSQYATCNATPTVCFGGGVLTMFANWFQWGDLTREHTHHSVILSGIPESVSAAVAGEGRWVTINTASFPVSQRASGGTFVASRDRYAQVEFAFTNVNGVVITYYAMPGWAGCSMQVFRNGVSVASVSLNGGSSYIRSLLTVNASTPGASTVVQLRSSGSCGVTLDAITPFIGEVLQETDSRITYAGPWSNASVVGASGGAFRTTSTTGASAYFVTTASDGFQIIYTARPDGGVAEVLINGQIVDEIDMYAPTQVPQSLHINGVWAGIKLVELRASGRRNAASRGQVISLDAVRFYSSMGSPAVNEDLTARALPNRPDFAADSEGEGVFLLPVNGSWSRVGSPAAFGGAFWSSNTPGAEMLFQLDHGGTSRRLALFYTGTPTGGQVEVLLNGQVCSTCGIIDTYRPVNMPRSVAVITLPDALPTQITIGLRITGERHANSTGTSFIFEGVRIVQGALIGVFRRLPYSDVAMNWSTPVSETRVPWYANDIVPRALPGSIYGDVHAIPRPNIFYGTTAGFKASSDTVALIVARSPQAGQMLIEYYHTGGFYSPLQTVELNATTTRPREMIVFQKPAAAYETGGLWFFRVSAQPGTSQTGSTGVFIFVDGVLAFGNGFIGRDWASPGGDDLVYPTAERDEVGTGWGSAPATIAAPSRSAEVGAPLRRTNAPGASFQFTYNPLVGDLELLYSRLPDGGIAEVYVDGQRFGEINFYSPTPLHFQIFLIPYDSSKTSAAVEIRNTNRRSPGSTGNWMYIDVLSSVAGHVQLPYWTSLMTQQETSASIQRIGAGWANLPAAPTGVVGPLGGAAQSVNQPGAVRFRMTGSSAWIMRTLLPNGGQAEVYVDGVRCTACGVVSFFNPTVSYRSPYRLTIPAIYGAPPYVVELRALPTRPAGSSGTVMTLDAVVPVTGSITNVIYTEFEDINTSGGTFITVTLPSSPIGAQLAVDNDVVRTTGSTGCAYVSAPTANPQVTVYYTRQSSGGIAEIRTGPNPASLDTCVTCGTINSFSPTTQYQVPHTFTAPVTAGQVIAVCQTGARQQGSTGFTLELDAVAFR